MRADAGRRLRELDAPDLWPEIERRIVAQDPVIRAGRVRAVLSVAALIVMVALAGWALYSLRGLGDGPATPAEAPAGTGLVGRLRILDDEEVPALLARQAIGDDRFLPIPGGRSAVIRLEWTSTTALPAGSRYQVVVIDRASGRAAMVLWTVPSITTGWSGQLDAAAGRYPWLAPAAPTCDERGCRERAIAAAADPRSTGPLWIVARWPDTRGRPGSVEPYPLVGVIATDDGGEVLWAQRVPLTNTLSDTVACPPVDDLVAAQGGAPDMAAYAVALEFIDHLRPGSHDPGAAWALLDRWYADGMGWAAAAEFGRSDEGTASSGGTISKLPHLVADARGSGSLSPSKYRDLLLVDAGIPPTACSETEKEALANSTWFVARAFPDTISPVNVFIVHRTSGYFVLGGP